MEFGAPDLRWEEQCRPWNGEDTFNGGFFAGVPAESVGPGNADVIDVDAAGFGEAETYVIPIVGEFYIGLLGLSQGEDVLVCSVVYL